MSCWRTARSSNYFRKPKRFPAAVTTARVMTMTDDELLHVYACHCWRCRDTRERLNQVWHLWFHGIGGGDGKLDRNTARSRYGTPFTVLHPLECTQSRTQVTRGRARGSVQLSQHEVHQLGRAESRRSGAPATGRTTRRRVLVPV